MRNSLSFSEALDLIKAGHQLQRAGWNGKGMWIRLNDQRHMERPDAPSVHLPYLEMWTADRKLVPWLCSQTDMLANDWQVVDA